MSLNQTLPLLVILTILIFSVIQEANACLPFQEIHGHASVQVVEGQKYAVYSNGERALIVPAEHQLTQEFNPDLVYCSRWEELADGSVIVWGKLLKNYHGEFTYDCLKLY